MADEEAPTATEEAQEENASSESLSDQLKDEIAVEVADAGVLRKKLTVTVPAKRIQEEKDGQYSDLINDAVVPGFRKGRAPRVLIEKRFGGEVGEQVVTRIVSNAYLAAIEKEDLKVLGDPVFRIPVTEKRRKQGGGSEEVREEKTLAINEALQHIKLPADGPLTFSCEVEVKPDFELPKLDGIPIQKPKIKITNDDVAKQIDRLRALSGEWAPVEGGAVEQDDMVVTGLKITVGKEVLHSEENVTVAARPQRVAGVPLEELGKTLVGAKSGDTRRLKVALPDDYEKEEFRGKQAAFEFAVHDIKRLRLPEIDQTYLDTLGFGNEKEFRDHIRKEMESRLEEEVRNGMRGQIGKFLVETTKLDLPEGMSARTVDRAVIRRIVDLRRRGVPQAEIEKHADELRTSARDQALRELKLHFILEKIAEDVEIEVTDEEVNGRIATIAQHYRRRFDRVRDELARDGGLESLALQIRDDKCIDGLLEKAKITEAKGPAQSMSKLADAT
ncbi:MAG: trigger factor [Phycisphaerae bacterium]